MYTAADRKREKWLEKKRGIETHVLLESWTGPRCPGIMEKNGSNLSSDYAFRNRISFVHWKTTSRPLGKNGSQLRGTQPDF